MNYRSLGKSGAYVSELSFGSWVTFSKQADVDLAAELIKTAYDAGVNFFDNAEVYEKGKSELVMGKALKKLGLRRDSFLVSSKVYGGVVDEPNPNQQGLSRIHIYDGCHQAMERLQADHLDLYFCHRPDPRIPMEEVVRSMTELIQQGKVRYWGTSEWSAQQLMEAHSVARQYNLIPPTMEQPQYNMFERYRFEVEYARLYDVIGLGTTIWSPLASGMLSGKYDETTPEDSRINLPGYEWLKKFFESDKGQERIRKTRELKTIADDLNTTRAQLALAWCLKNENVSTVITGASRLSQLQENLNALDVVPALTGEIMDKIEDVIQTRPDPMEFQIAKD
ncbi:potassium channel beta subunit family protein [Salinispira pacifica]|uniref:Voltage-gated potassium channel beta subunit n=1 Tax=Salinispira pacifica TaxID=1307761 RepID=V5WM92_9SPIO|nr:aldo/keto reductase [Salinispira pacifica]AHC16740.1 Voltage-gated potassium channel beta subunit [Salinispira pacifica]